MHTPCGSTHALEEEALVLQYIREETTGKTKEPKFDYELFNCNNFNIRYWSWNYRGCWHQTCPPMVPR